MTGEQALTFVDAQRWIFAKSMPQWPHWYCLRTETLDSAAFDAFVCLIQETGYLAEFQPEDRSEWSVRRYLDIGPHHYWTMTETPSEATLINRAEHPSISVRL